MKLHACHRNMICVMGKTRIKIFIVVISKEVLAGGTQPLYGYDDYKIVICYLHRLYSKVGVIPKERLARPHLPILLLVWRQKSWGMFSHNTTHMWKLTSTDLSFGKLKPSTSKALIYERSKHMNSVLEVRLELWQAENICELLVHGLRPNVWYRKTVTWFSKQWPLLNCKQCKYYSSRLRPCVKKIVPNIYLVISHSNSGLSIRAGAVALVQLLGACAKLKQTVHACEGSVAQALLPITLSATAYCETYWQLFLVFFLLNVLIIVQQ